jgi:hypothetical protein
VVVSKFEKVLSPPPLCEKYRYLRYLMTAVMTGHSVMESSTYEVVGIDRLTLQDDATLCERLAV